MASNVKRDAVEVENQLSIQDTDIPISIMSPNASNIQNEELASGSLRPRKNNPKLESPVKALDSSVLVTERRGS